MTTIPDNDNDFVVSNSGELSKHSYTNIIKALDTRLTAEIDKQNSTLAELNATFDTLLTEVRKEALKAETRRSRVVRREKLPPNKYGNCRCSGSSKPTKPSDLGGGDMTSGYGKEYNTACVKEKGISHTFSKDECPDKTKQTCGVGSLYQWKCNLPVNSDPYWKGSEIYQRLDTSKAPLDQASIEPGGKATTFIKFIDRPLQALYDTMEELRAADGLQWAESEAERKGARGDILRLVMNTPGELPSNVVATKTIMLSDQNGNLSTISCESTLIKLITKINEVQSSFAFESSNLTNKIITAKNIINMTVERINKSFNTNIEKVPLTVRPVGIPYGAVTSFQGPEDRFFTNYFIPNV